MSTGITRETNFKTCEESKYQCELVYVLPWELGYSVIDHSSWKCSAAILFQGKKGILKRPALSPSAAYGKDYPSNI